MSITNLTQDPFKEIIQHLNVFEIRALSLTCKDIHTILGSIAKFIKSMPFAKSLYGRVIPITQGPTFQTMVRAPKKLPELMTPIQLATLAQCDLCDTIKSYKEQIPEEIKNLVNSQELLNPKEIEQLNAYKKARDTIIIWAVIAKAGNLTLPFNVDNIFCSQSKNVMDKSKKYQKWSENNSNILSTITTLGLHQNKIEDLTPLENFSKSKHA